jgi:hypothetical protein
MLSGGEEYKPNWGGFGRGMWLLKDGSIKEFKELNYSELNVEEEEKSEKWNEFIQSLFTVPEGEIIALVLDGNTGDTETTAQQPHQLEVIWHLLFIEKFDVDYILVHKGDGKPLESNMIPARFLCCEQIVLLKGEDEYKIQFMDVKKKEEKKIDFFDYTLMGDRAKIMGKIGIWMEAISRSVRDEHYAFSIKMLEKLAEILTDFIKSSYEKDIIIAFFSNIFTFIPSLFLPVLIDIKGLNEVFSRKPLIPARESKENTIEKYLKEIIKDKEDNYFSQKLYDARYLIFGGSGIKIKSKGDEGDVSYFLKSKFHGMNFEEIVSEYPEIEKKLCDTLGLVINEGKFEGKSEFPILSLLKFMDELGKKAEITSNDASEIVAHEEEFSKWYDKLIYELEQFKKKEAFL